MDLSVNKTSPSLNFIEQQNKRREEEEEQLASGKRINDAADDPAGLQIASRLTSEINASQQQAVNAQDEINTLQVQDGGLAAINEGLQRANVLSVQSGNPVNDPAAIQQEFDEITEQVNALSEEFLGNDSLLSGLDASDPAATQAALENAFETISAQAVQNGADENALGSQVDTYSTTVVNSSASRSRIQDTDFAASSGNLQQANVLLETAITSKKDEEARKGLLINQLV